MPDRSYWLVVGDVRIEVTRTMALSAVPNKFVRVETDTGWRLL